MPRKVSLIYSRQNRTDDAIAALERLTSLYGAEFAMPHNNLALQYLSVGRMDEAIAAMEAALAVEPANPIFAINLSDMLLAEGQPVSAAAVLQASADLFDAGTDRSHMVRPENIFSVTRP